MIDIEHHTPAHLPGMLLPCQRGLWKARTVDAEVMSAAIRNAHHDAWVRGDDGFVYTLEMACRDGVA